MKTVSIALLGLLGTPLWAQTPAPAPTPVGPLPTRMQFCQQEVQGLAGDERKAALRTCLVRRAKGERLVTSDCQQQVRDVPTEPANRLKLMRECEYRALSVPSSELPQPLVPIPSPVREAPPAPSPEGDASTGASAPASVQATDALSELDRAVAPVHLPDAP